MEVATATKPWYLRLSDEDRAWLFRYESPEDFAARMAREERDYGIPQKCEHVPTLLLVARIFAA